MIIYALKSCQTHFLPSKQLKTTLAMLPLFCPYCVIMDHFLSVNWERLFSIAGVIETPRRFLM